VNLYRSYMGEKSGGERKRSPKGKPKPSRYRIDGEAIFNREGQEGWRLRFTANKKRIERLHWGTYESAVIALREAKEESANIGQIPVDRSITLTQLLTDWVSDYRYVDGVERPRTTWKEHDGNTHRYLLPALRKLQWENHRVTAYTSREIETIVDTCRPVGKGEFSPSVRKSIRKTLRMAFEEARRRGITDVNVAAGGNTSWKPQPVVKFIPTPDQMEAVAALMDANQEGESPTYGAMLRFLYFTGLRISEALGLKLTDVHERNSYLHVQGKATVSGGRKTETSNTKTALSNRHVTLLARARPSYETLKNNAHQRGSIYLFCGSGRRAHRKNADGNWVTVNAPECVGYGTLAQSLRQACADAIAQGLISEPFTFHSCRHGYATMLRSVGVPDAEIADELGHSSARLVKTLYGASKFDVDQSARAREQGRAIDRLLDTDRDPYDMGAIDIGPLFPE